VIIKGWDGRDIHGECSKGGQIFSALDWRELVLAVGGPYREAIERKARQPSRHGSAYAPAALNRLKERDGHYCSLQSINSEDTVTWSVFGAHNMAPWVEDLFSLAFGSGTPPAPWKPHFWKRFPHPEKESADGPEPDMYFESCNGWSCAVEAKWLNTDLDKGQGYSGNKTQLEMRASFVKNQLIIAPSPSRYPPATNNSSTFHRYFRVLGDRYEPTYGASELGNIQAATWEQIEALLRQRTEPAAAVVASYLRWRLDKLPEKKMDRRS
jgi:hypothetical protein